MVRAAKTVLETKRRLEASQQEQARPVRRARQLEKEQVHSTATDLGTGRKSSRLGEVNRVPKPARRRWMRPSTLPHVPVNAIAGFRTRYNRIDGRKFGDRRNLEARIHEGWELVRRDELPKYSLPTHTLTRHGEVIGNDDMVLMKLHEDLVEQRNDEYQGRARRQTKGVLDQLREMGQKTESKVRANVKGHTDIPRRNREVKVRDDDE